MDACDKLKANGVEPIAYGVKNKLIHWPMRVIMDSVASSEMDKLDTDDSYFVTLDEICAGVDNGVLDLSKEPWLSTYSILQDYSTRWYPGATSMEQETMIAKFAAGETAFMHCAIWMLRSLMNNPELEFDVGVTRMPAITTETNPKADGKYHNLWGAPNEVCLVSEQLKGDELEAAVDFVKFLTGEYAASVRAKEQLKISSIASEFMPTAGGKVGEFSLDYTVSRLQLYEPVVSKKFFDSNFTVGQPLVNGEITPEEAGAQQQAILVEEVEKIKEQNGWTKENNYGRD